MKKKQQNEEDKSSFDSQQQHKHYGKFCQQNQQRTTTNLNITQSTNFIIFYRHIQQSNSNTNPFTQNTLFSNKLTVNVINTNFQSTTINLHYSNFSLLCNILFMSCLFKMFQPLMLLGTGSFGRVYEFQNEGKCFAIKIINIKNGIQKGYSRELYKQYFLNCLADQLGVGPKVIPLFGYDLIITEDAVIFCMQKCSPPKLDHKKNIQKQLQQNLSLMHSIGFVHLDIKPENIAFSEVLQKHVFIDFGLSSLIRQRVGQKSMTSFLGTLHYCSEQMKKCYILGSRMFVDLYENDRVSLNKTLKQEKIRICSYQSSIIIKNERSFQFSAREENQNNILIKNFFIILKLKHQIFLNNFQQAQSLLQRCVDLPRCCCEILESKSNKKQVGQDIRIKEILKRIKNKMLNNLQKIDQQIYGYINEQVCLNLIQYSFPIEGIIKMQKQSFISLFAQQNWVIKIFLFLNPFESQGIKQVQDHVWKYRRKLIEKIFQTFASVQQIKRSNRFSHFISLKSQFSLLLFYERTKQLKNLNILISLRLLLIVTMAKLDSKLIQRIEQEILQLTKDEDELILRIISFYFFWKTHYLQFDFENIQLNKWIQKVIRQNHQSESDIGQNIGVLKSLISNDPSKFDKYLFYERGRRKLRLFSMNSNGKHEQLKKNISHLFAQQINQVMNMDLEFDDEFQQDFLYYSYRNNFIKSTTCFTLSQKNLQKVFVKFNNQFLRQYCGERDNDDIFDDFENFMVICEIIGFNERILSYFPLVKKNNPENMFHLLKAIQRQCYENSKQYVDIFLNLCWIALFLSHQCMILSNEQSIFTKKQMQQIINKINKLIIFLQQLCCKSMNQKLFQIKIKSIKIVLVMNKQQQKIRIIKQLMQLIKDFNLSNLLQSKIILTIFNDLFDQVLSNNSNYLMLQNYYQNYCDQLIISGGIMLFWKCQNILEMLIRIKIFKNKKQQALKYVLLAYEQFNGLKDDIQMSIKKILEKIKKLFFSKIKNNQFLYEKYHYFLNNKYFNNENLIILFEMFLRIKSKLSINDRLLFLHKCILCIQNFKLLFSQQLKLAVFKQAIQIGLYKTQKQKQLFYKRMNQIYGNLYSNFLFEYDKICFEMMWKIQNKKIQRVLNNKITNYFLN